MPATAPLFAPEPSWARYERYVADMIYQVNEARRWKARWYADQAKFVQRQTAGNPNATTEDAKFNYGKTPQAQDNAGMEQWCARQANMYALAAQVELDRLKVHDVPLAVVRAGSA